MSLLDRHNAHLFLEKPNNKGNSFIANVNRLVAQLELLERVDGLFTEEDVAKMLTIASIDFAVVSEDLLKGSLNGYRKLDINLLENFAEYDSDMSDEEKRTLWNTESKQVYYEGATVYFVDKTSIYKEFNELGITTPINNHHQLYSQLDSWAEFKAKANYTMFNIVTDTPLENHELLRLWDGEASGSTIDKIVLHVAPEGQNLNYDAVFAGAKDYNPEYDWMSSTSILTTIANKINELLAVSTNVQEILVIKSYLTELTHIYGALDALAGTDPKNPSIYQMLNTLAYVAENMESVKNAATVVEQVEKVADKADKIKEATPIEYTVTSTFSVPNSTKNFLIGDVLTSGNFTFTVSQTNAAEGMILGGVITPTTVNVDYSGYHQFLSEKNPTESLEVDIICTPSSTLAPSVKNLSDAYTELKSRANAASDLIRYLYTALGETNSYLEELEKLIGKIQISGDGTTLEGVVMKTSSIPQIINSDIVLALNKKLFGTKNDGNSTTLLQILKTIERGLVKDVVSVGTTNEHLNLRTNIDNVHDYYISVNTPKGLKEIPYRDEIVNDIAVNFLVGSCIPWAGATIPEQCKLAVGDVYSIEDFPEAGAVLGNKYGGDGVTTFGTPDLRNKEPVALTWVIVLGKDSGSSTRLYCGRDGIYCGLEGLYPGMAITS